MAENFYLLLNAALFICAGISLVVWLRLLPAIFRKGVLGFADTWLPVRRRECPFWALPKSLSCSDR